MDTRPHILKRGTHQRGAYWERKEKRKKKKEQKRGTHQRGVYWERKKKKRKKKEQKREVLTKEEFAEPGRKFSRNSGRELLFFRRLL